MKTDIQKGENSTVVANVTVDNDKVEQIYERVLSNAMKFTTVPGFRKGKAPKKLAQKNLNMDMVKQHAIEDLVSETLYNIIKENDIRAIASPDIEVLSFEPEGELVYKATIEVLPEFEIGAYDNFEIEVEKPHLKEESVEKALANLQDQYSHFKEIESTDKSVEIGDFALLDFEGFENGKKIDEASAENRRIEVIQEAFIPGFVDNITGMKKNESKEFELTFPEDYHPSLKGKTVLFRVTLHSIEEKVLPELDDDFAKKTSELETIEELRQDIRKRMNENIDERANFDSKNKVSEKLAELVTIEIPESLVVAEQQKLLDRMSFKYAQYGVDIFKNLTDEQIMEFAEDKRPEALVRVKTDLALGEIVKKEGITVSDEELEEKLREIARQSNQDFRKFKSQLEKTGRIDSLREVLKKERALHKVLEMTAVRFVEPAEKEESKV